MKVKVKVKVEGEGKVPLDRWMGSCGVLLVMDIDWIGLGVLNP